VLEINSLEDFVTVLRRVLTPIVFLLASTIAFSQSATIVSPSGSSTTSPVRVVADFSNNAPIDSISVSVDGSTALSQSEAVTPLDVSVPVSDGSHIITVTAVQSDGLQLTASKSVDVSSASTGSTATALTASTSSTSGSGSFGHIERMSGWYTYPDQGNPVCSSKPTLVSSPSLDGTSGKFYLGPKGQYNNCLWPILLGSSTTATHFTLDTHYQLSNPSVAQGVEFSSNKHIGTQWYKFSVQCSYNKGVFSVWDTAGGKWSATNIPCKRPKLGSWDHLTVNTQISGGKAVFLSLTFNGTTYTINKSFYPSKQTSSYSYGVHFQMDGNQAGNAYYAYVDNLQYSLW
jgi:hypothetical protein